MMARVRDRRISRSLMVIVSSLAMLMVGTRAIASEDSVSDFSSQSIASLDVPPLGSGDRYLPETAVTHLRLDLSDRRVYVERGEERIASYPVAIGKSQTPTPTGTYEVFQMIEDPIWQSPWTGQVTPPGPNSALGLRWIGFAQMSNGVIGFHGTPTVSSIGKAASNGCVRMYNKDVLAMFEQVGMGTTVIVQH
ncbi:MULTISPECIES: L,D-transpeptidase [Spirulina sp. CCY15215]|uniref:L,D-transpeptidase n=1 Tax=Spirulina sp. CCY15215 TaxID=2767591 RepID=UPI001951AC72